MASNQVKVSVRGLPATRRRLWLARQLGRIGLKGAGRICANSALKHGFEMRIGSRPWKRCPIPASIRGDQIVFDESVSVNCG